jgi:hypothetical protein
LNAGSSVRQHSQQLHAAQLASVAATQPSLRHLVIGHVSTSARETQSNV